MRCPTTTRERLAARVRIDYPISIDRVIGLGVPPTVRLQAASRTPAPINPFERMLVWCHWVWFMVPHGTLGVCAAARPGALSRRRGPDVRGLRPRRRLLLGDPDRAAWYAARTAALRMRPVRGAADDDRVRRAVLG